MINYLIFLGKVVGDRAEIQSLFLN